MSNTTSMFQKSFTALLLSTVIFLASCMKKTTDAPAGTTAPTTNAENNPLGIVTPSSFNWDNFSEVSLNLIFKTPDSQPLKNTLINIYDKNIEEGGVVLFTALTDENGKLTQKMMLPSYLTEVVVDADFMGLIRNATVRVVNKTISCSIGGPEGYSGNLVPAPSFTGKPSTSVAGRIDAATPYSFMGAYSSTGVPKYLEPANDVIETELLSFINVSLPEQKSAPILHPEYIDHNSKINLDITALSDVWITFVHEGAGNTNTLAYFTYPTKKMPKTIGEIDSLHIILPNASLNGSGGGLVSGNKVKLGRFPKDVSIGFCLIANGWNGTSVGAGTEKFYSIDDLNPEVDTKIKRHAVLLYDAKRSLFLTGFEDINRSSASCDQDFNDIVFYSKANPVTAIDTKDVMPIATPADTDKDGVLDANDLFPNDPTRAYISYYPSEKVFSTIAFEDNWPYMGDYDMNDMVVDYRYKMINNASNNTVEMYCDYVVRASGAAKRNGFGVELPFTADFIDKVTGSLVADRNVTEIGSNGIETKVNRTVIVPFDDVFTIAKASNPFMLNTVPGNGYLQIDTIHMLMKFKSALTSGQLGLAPFNPFLIVNRDRSHEVHLPGYKPTEKVNSKLFGTGADNSNPATGVYYKSKSNLPFALALPETWSYPSEYKSIADTYTKFAEWAASGGITWTNWYKDLIVRKDANIYKK